ncbi:MAG: putative ABC transport system permease protein [Planctomycetota bacterium]|jgi:putative ABC transport system permease protein
MRLLFVSSLRDAMRHPWLALLFVVGIAASVALVVAIDLAIESSSRAFTLSTDALKGDATHRILGGPSGIPEGYYRELRVTHGLRKIAPIIEADLRSASPAEGWVRLLGIDPWAESTFRPGLQPDNQQANGPNELVAQAGSALLSRRRADRLGLNKGESIELIVNGELKKVTICGFYTLQGEAASAPDDIMVVDLATAQELLGKEGFLTAIDVILSGDQESDTAQAIISRTLPTGLTLTEVDSRGNSDQLLMAFRQNLEFLSLLALVVAAFLVYNTATFSVVRQRELYGRFRSLGASSGQVLGAVMLSALVFGALGTVLGVALGIALGSGLVGIVSQTINDLYFVVTVNEVALSPVTLAKGILLGLGATLAATYVPAREAAHAPLRRVMSRADIELRAGRRAPHWAKAGVLAIVAGGAIIAWPQGGLWACQIALAFFILGFAWMTPLATRGLATLVRNPVGKLFGMTGRMASRGIHTSLSRTSVAVGALGIALALTLSVGQMISTFRVSVVDWLETTLAADVYVTVPRPVAGSRTSAELSPALVKRLMAAPGIASTTTNRTVRIQSRDQEHKLVVLSLDPTRPRGFSFTKGDDDAIWREFDHEDCILLSEPFASQFDMTVGDEIPLSTRNGEKIFRVNGVFRDFASEHGYIIMSRPTYDRHWDDPRVTALGLFAKPGHDLLRELNAIVGENQGLTIQSQGDLKRTSIEIFDRTFTITSVLRLLSAVVAFIGVFSALMAIQLERRREIGILRAAGMTKKGIALLGVVQSALLGLFAGLLAIPLGIVFTWILTVPVNQRSFGWTLPFDFEPLSLVVIVAFGVLTAVVAGALPAWLMSRLEVAKALRGDG